jgi:hypothetical protein
VSDPLTVPTRWVKFVFAIFLLPICGILSQTFFTAFARAAVAQRLWAGEEFWFFSLGAILWLIAFFGLPRPILIYVFGHELTHALWVWLMGGRVSRFRVGRDGGHVVTNKANFWIALAPYFFPLYSILAIAIYGALSLFVNMQPYGRCVPFHVHVLDGSEKSDRPERSGHVLLARHNLFDEPAAAKRDAHSCVATNYVSGIWRRFADQLRKVRAVDLPLGPRFRAATLV